MAEEEKNALNTRDFSRVVLTLDNVLLPPEKVSESPSMADGVDVDVEYGLRVLGCELIQMSGHLLELPQVAMATGQVLYQRFYYAKSFVKHPMEILAMACINLATKIEECQRRVRDVINVFHRMKQVRNEKKIQPLPLDATYSSLKNQVIKSERRILKELGFCVHVKNPHKTIITFLQVLDQHMNNSLVQCAWNYMNDSFRTTVFCRFPPETVGAACIWLAARQLHIPLPSNPHWFYVFKITEAEIEEIALEILKLYSRAKPNWDELDKALNLVKQKHLEEKLKLKGIGGDNTPNSHSLLGTPSKNDHSPLPDHLSTRADKENRELEKPATNHRGGSDGERSRKKRSRSRSASSRASSRSNSRSPTNKRKRRPPSPIRAPRGGGKHDKYHRGDRNHRNARSRSRSVSRTPDRKLSKKYRRDKTGSRYRSRSRSRSRDHYDKGFDARNYIKATKKSNGHHRDRSRERYRR